MVASLTTVSDESVVGGLKPRSREVTDGYDVVEAISRTPTKGQDRPVTDVVLERVDISD